MLACRPAKPMQLTQHSTYSTNSIQPNGGVGVAVWVVATGHAALLHAYIRPGRSLLQQCSLQCCDDLARTCGLRTCLVMLIHCRPELRSNCVHGTYSWLGNTGMLQ
jgi:hypothetical protein